MTPKQIATTFLQQAGGGKAPEAFQQFTAPGFIHHNQYFKGDRQSLQNAMVEDDATNPNKSLEVKHIYEDNDRVITHSLVSKEDMQIAVIHIFRFEGDKLAELWDLGQPLLDDSPNEYGMF